MPKDGFPIGLCFLCYFSKVRRPQGLDSSGDIVFGEILLRPRALPPVRRAVPAIIIGPAAHRLALATRNEA
jgi:hypothetical protein